MDHTICKKEVIEMKETQRWARELAAQEYNNDYWLVSKLINGEFE